MGLRWPNYIIIQQINTFKSGSGNLSGYRVVLVGSGVTPGSVTLVLV